MGMRRFRWLLALFVGFALFAAACGSDGDSDSADGDTADESESEADSEADEPEETDEDSTADESESDDSADSAEEPAEDEAAADDEAEMAMEPEYGGSLTFLLEGETDTWFIPAANCAESCINVMRAIADPLMIINEDREIEPHLLESLTNDDGEFMEWTLVVRDGITFHDGTNLDGAALQRHLVETADGLLTGQLLVDLENGTDSIELIDDKTVKVTFDRPVSVFPNFLAERIGAWVYSPSYYDDPDRAQALPISTGPFQMVEWNRDESTVLARNENYWRTDDAGNQLPYLDEVVFRPNPDSFARKATMEAGDADVNMESVTDNEDFWRTTWLEDGGGIVDYEPERQSSYLLLNAAIPPFDNPDMRRALAMCSDRPEFIIFRSPDNDLSDGPFSPETPGYLEDTGFPDFDPEAGNALLDEIGRPDAIVYSYQDTPGNKLNGELWQDQWSTNCDLNVELDPFDQAELVTRALTGNFGLLQWRNHGNEHPGWEELWWHSRHAEGLALNFNRIINPDLDALLDQSWATNDPDELAALAEDMNAILGENVYNLWLWYSDWIHAYAAGVHNVNEMTLESGNAALDSLAGRIWVQEAWKES